MFCVAGAEFIRRLPRPCQAFPQDWGLGGGLAWPARLNNMNVVVQAPVRPTPDKVGVYTKSPAGVERTRAAVPRQPPFPVIRSLFPVTCSAPRPPILGENLYRNIHVATPSQSVPPRVGGLGGRLAKRFVRLQAAPTVEEDRRYAKPNAPPERQHQYENSMRAQPKTLL